MLRDQLLNCGPLVPERNGWENRFMVRRPVLGAVAVFAAATGCGGRATHGGPSDAGQNVSPPGAPGTPTFIVQGPVVQVSWTAPVDDGGAAITQ